MTWAASLHSAVPLMKGLVKGDMMGGTRNFFPTTHSSHQQLKHNMVEAISLSRFNYIRCYPIQEQKAGVDGNMHPPPLDEITRQAGNHSIGCSVELRPTLIVTDL